MLSRLMSRGTIGVLRPYLDDTVLYLVTQTRDPYPAVKVEALSILAKLALDPRLEQVSCLDANSSAGVQFTPREDG